MYRIKLIPIVILYLFFGIIDFITGSMWWSLKLCFQSDIFPLSLWNPIRLPPITFFILGLTLYLCAEIFKLENDRAFKAGALIAILDVLKLYFDTMLILNFNIKPHIGYYLEIISLFGFLALTSVLIKYRDALWVAVKSQRSN